MNRCCAIALLGLMALSAAPARAANEIGFVEDYVLAKDKDAAIAKLMPGTEEHFFYQCIRHQAAGELGKVDGLLKTWLDRTKGRHTSLMVEIENRQALLKYRQDPKGSLAYLAKKLNLHFNHERQVARRSSLPTRLDPKLIGRDTLSKRAFAQDSRLGGFETSAVEWLIGQDLNERRRRHLLEMLSRPDYDGLAPLIAADLKAKDSRGFGSIGIHNRLLRAQLDELRKLRPELARNSKFVNLYLTRLRPSNDVDWPNNPAERLAYLDRMWAFVRGLDPAFNSLKANILYHRLAFDLERGTYDADLFMTYVKLPRRVSYVRPEYLDLKAHRGVQASLSSSYSSATSLGAIGNDEPLVRRYLAHFFVEAENYDAYSAYIRDTYLKGVFAETKLLNGIGDGAKWTALLSPPVYKALTERVDLDFAPTNPKHFAPGEKVALDVFVKNVEKLIVKVYRVNARKYYQEKAQPVPIGLDLDGLVANEQKTYAYKVPPVRRVRRRFEFPQLRGRGVFVIELIGSGKRSRALVRKGKLGFVVRTTPAGHEFTVLDETGAEVLGAQLWMAGHLYDAEDDGTVTVPFTNSPRSQSVVLLHGGGASLASFDHLAESYNLTCGFFVDREALIKRRKASLLVRPQARLAGMPISLSLLKEVELTVTSTDLDGVNTTQRIKDFKLFEDRESTYDFRVPDRLARITFGLTAKIKNLSKDREETLSASRTFTLNGIDATSLVEDLHLLKADGGYVLEMRGRNGEPIPERPVALVLKHRDFKQTVTVSLKTDARGRITLGALKNITRIDTRHGPKLEAKHQWSFWGDAHNLPRILHGRAGGTIAIPWMRPAAKPQRDELSLLEVRSGQYVADRFGALRIAGGMLETRGLPAGDYSLRLKRSGQQIEIKITDGKDVAGYLTSPNRRLEVRDAKGVQIVDVTTDKDTIKVRLTNATEFTRVHIAAARYMPEYPLYPSLHPFGWLAPGESRARPVESFYIAGRKISDEYRYILDRQYARKRPGNMLKRPSLILNPWSPRQADTGRAHGGKGESLTRPGETAAGARSAKFFGSGRGKRAVGNFANLDFLSNAAFVATNLRPDKNGVVTIQRKDLAGKQHVRVLAADPEHTAYRQVALTEAPAKLRDLRLDAADALDPARHYTQQKKITPAPKGKPFTFRDLTATRFETFDSLAGVYRLYTTLNGDANLREFAFVLGWPKLTDDEKRAKYSKYACHELNFFLYRRDPGFFRGVVLPYLKNKKDKTFLDHWLCGEDLGEYLKPWRHAQLNTVERILLAQRVAGEGPATARHVRDLHDLLTPDVDRLNRLFDTALGLSRLRPTAEGGEEAEDLGELVVTEDAIRDLARKVRKRNGVALKKLEAAARPAPPATPAPKPKAAPSPKAPAAARSRGTVAGYYDAKAAKRLDARQFYRKVGQVREWVENNYYHLPNQRANAALITVNAFWRDYAAWDGKGKFVSPNFAEASRNFPEMMFALAVLDLPFEAPKHKVALDGSSMVFTPGDQAVVFHEEINESPSVPKVRPILVSQNYYRLGERYRHVNGEQIDNFVTDEFLRGVPYGCHVVVTNPTSARRKLHVLTQLPRGAMPLAKGRNTKTSYIVLEPYRTQTFDFVFYFPAEGTLDHYPVHVARRGKLVAFAEPAKLEVVAKLTKVDKASWEFVSQNGTSDDVIAFLKANNIHRHDLGLIAWRMKDKAFFRTVLGLLTQRHVYHNTLWSYAVKHDEPKAVREYLQHNDGFLRQCGQVLDTPLVVLDPVVRKWYQHVEYWPLVNARAHTFGGRRKILVDRFHAQYHELMNILRYRAELTDDDRMALTCYLLLQDRVEEAGPIFAAVNPANLPERLQHDYFTAYLDFFQDRPTKARKIASMYADYPVERWRNLFGAVLAQLDEIEGKAPRVVDKKDRDEAQTNLATTEQTFELDVEAGKITLNYQNLDAVRVNYYLMDIELMFSRQPFVKDHGGQFAYIQPNETQEIKLPAGGKSIAVELPKSLRNRNVMVEVVAGGKTRTQAYYSHSLVVQMMENYGQLRVTHQETGKPLAKTYVKVYSRMKNGQVEFYKDGYTDLRGRFDYTSLNTDQLAGVDTFGVLVLSESDGSTVREARPPKR